LDLEQQKTHDSKHSETVSWFHDIIEHPEEFSLKVVYLFIREAKCEGRLAHPVQSANAQPPLQLRKGEGYVQGDVGYHHLLRMQSSGQQ
jgi:hypothetical protein